MSTTTRLLASISFLSAAIIAFQLALIQILSNVQWYHFAFMIISVALLGFGAAGTLLALFRNKLLKHIDTLLPLLMIATGVAMALVTDLSQISFIRFDSYSLFVEYSHTVRLLLTYLVFFIPFFSGALAIGLIFVNYVDQINKIYFLNLLGSGAGGILGLVLIWFIFPRQLPAYIAVLPLLAGLLIIKKSKLRLPIAFAVLSAIIVCWKILDPPRLRMSEYKDLEKTLLLPEAKIVLEKTSPYGVLQMVSSPVLRYAPGMSLTAQKPAQIKMAAFINGDWFGAITDWRKTDSSMVLDYTTLALPYQMATRSRALILRAGTGIDIAHSISRNTKEVIAVEANSIILSVLRREFVSETDSLLFHPSVSVFNVEPRTFLSMDSSRFDLIQLPVVGTFGGSSGLHALNEQFILTKESFSLMWHKLNAGGVISVTSWMDYPVRNPLKLLATMVEALRDAGVQSPKDHIAAIRSWGTITYVMTKSPLTTKEVVNIRRFCDEMMFDPAILPNISDEEKTRYNQFQDNHFFGYIEKIFSSENEMFFADYDFNIRPATDNKPYFSQYIKWGNLKRLGEFFGNRSIPFFEIGYLLVIITLIQITVASIIFIIVPLFKLSWKGKSKRSILLYFSGIGIGYMFIEMVFLQRFILYFGNPVYSASAAITSLLIFSGLGSYFSHYFLIQRKRLRFLFSFIVSMLLIYSFLLTPVLRETIHVNLILKIFIVFLLIAPIAFCMGVPFPAGLSIISKNQAAVVPWAWGINGCVSVISTALATVAAVETGFTIVMIFAALAYCMPLLARLD
jgi:hypothetical protein